LILIQETTIEGTPMNKLIKSAAILLASVILLGGCVAAIGNREGRGNGTVGQELIDLKKAKDAGVLTDAEYAEQRAKMLGHK
jgi:hypothetical protein